MESTQVSPHLTNNKNTNSSNSKNNKNNHNERKNRSTNQQQKSKSYTGTQRWKTRRYWRYYSLLHSRIEMIQCDDIQSWVQPVILSTLQVLFAPKSVFWLKTKTKSLARRRLESIILYVSLNTILKWLLHHTVREPAVKKHQQREEMNKNYS